MRFSDGSSDMGCNETYGWPGRVFLFLRYQSHEKGTIGSRLPWSTYSTWEEQTREETVLFLCGGGMSSQETFDVQCCGSSSSNKYIGRGDIITKEDIALLLVRKVPISTWYLKWKRRKKLSNWRPFKDINVLCWCCSLKPFKYSFVFKNDRR